MNKITIPMPDDFHLHLRDGETLGNMAPHSARQVARGLTMPNLHPEPVTTGDHITDYRKRVVYAAGRHFEPLMTFQITPQTTPKMIRDAKRAGAIAGKVYPLGMTTNSENGVLEYQTPPMRLVYKTMQELGLLLLLHGEHPKSEYCLDRECDFGQIVQFIALRYPRLRIVWEHITDARSIEIIHEFENVAATVTVHHLFLTLNDVIGDKLMPHHFCKPVAKRPSDQRALVQAALSGHPRIFLGTDSAPHTRGKKECHEGCAGVFTAPVAMPLLAELFDKHEKLDRLADFTSKFGAEYYGLPRNTGMLTLVRRPMEVPEEYSGVVPFMAGKVIDWKVV